MHVLISCKNEEDSIKMKAPEWPQHISSCKSVGIFPDTQGQLTRQSIIGSGRNSNYVETLWLSSLSARMEKIRFKNEGDRELIIVNISHESKSVGNSEADIWQWVCLIG